MFIDQPFKIGLAFYQSNINVENSEQAGLKIIRVAQTIIWSLR
ncbi:unnamed protein product [Paramecium primaurelia]|uniref:Uncharacterized protein n=1 Tax=Paramecium primaurelia TaxID=5886 RepID=A0A8S1PX09_PARPR|nr:unnamed protein product [Paramecium primaurelia]